MGRRQSDVGTTSLMCVQNTHTQGVQWHSPVKHVKWHSPVKHVKYVHVYNLLHVIRSGLRISLVSKWYHIFPTVISPFLFMRVPETVQKETKLMLESDLVKREINYILCLAGSHSAILGVYQLQLPICITELEA